MNLTRITVFLISFGHTPIQNFPKIREHFANIDTGCCLDFEGGYGMLSVYCIETNEVVSVI